MAFGLQDPSRAFRYVLVLLGVTFAWGALSANVAWLRSARPIAGFARNRAVALPVLGAWIVLAFTLSRKYMQAVGGGSAEGLRLGVVLAGTALLFDLIVVAGLARQGLQHFRQTAVWLGYAVLIAVPWLVARGR